MLYGYVLLLLPWGWYWTEEEFKLTGNWIIRVVGETGASTPDQGIPDQKVTKPDQKVIKPDTTASPDLTSTKKDGNVTKIDGGVTKKDSGKTGPAAGTEGGACYPDNTCNAGLSCLSKLCVKAPAEESSGCSVGPADLGDPRLVLLLALVAAAVLLRRRRHG